jgi:glycosyltransferase involved in cell wall biosynthesis
MAKITVVIATRNAAAWITEALESVRAQTYPSGKIETIVVDYGSTDASIPLARWFLERHRMKGAVIATDQPTGIGAALNIGWGAATGDWIQVIKGQSLLAPNKIEVQANLIPQLPVDVRIVSSSWQCMGSDGSERQVPGPIFCPNLQSAPPVVLPSHEACPVVLKVVSNRRMPLGASLFRRGAIQDVGGFSEEVNFAVDEHFILKMLGVVERGNPSDLSSDRFAEAPSSSPLFIECEVPGAGSRQWKVGFAQEHLENVLLARGILLENQLGRLTLENSREISRLACASLSDLREHARIEFKRCARRLAEIDPNLVPAEFASSRPTKQRSPDILEPLRRLTTSVPAETLAQRARSRAWRMPSQDLRVIERTGPHQLTSLVGGRMRTILVQGALSVVGATLLFGGMLASYPFRTHEIQSAVMSRAEPPPVQRPATGALIINVASTIYAEPMSPWPMPIEIGPSHRVPADGALQVRGLPSAATLSEGRRVSGGAWAVPMTRLSGLELTVAAEFSGKADLALALVGADGSVLAEAQTTLSISEPPAKVASAAVLLPDARAVQRAAPSSETAVIPLPPILTATRPEPPPTLQDPITIRPPEAPRMPTSGSDATAPAAPLRRETVSSVASELPSPAPLATAKLDDGHAGALQIQDRAVPEAEAAPSAVMHPAPARATVTSADVAPKPDQGTAAIGSPSGLEDHQLVERIVTRGERHLSEGNVAVARQFFVRAAEAGVARAALLLASTYDPYEFANLGIRGVQPNSTEARKWYKRAAELGAPQAAGRILQLGAAE